MHGKKIQTTCTYSKSYQSKPNNSEYHKISSVYYIVASIMSSVHLVHNPLCIQKYVAAHSAFFYSPHKVSLRLG